LIYDGIVFIAACIAVADASSDSTFAEWSLVAVLVALPLIVLTWTALAKLRQGLVLPTGANGRVLASVQVFGSVGLASAVAVPVLVLWSYFHPLGRLELENQTQYATVVTLLGHTNDEGCSGFGIVPPNTSMSLKLEFHGIECWGDAPTTLQLSNTNGTWRCAW